MSNVSPDMTNGKMERISEDSFKRFLELQEHFHDHAHEALKRYTSITSPEDSTATYYHVESIEDNTIHFAWEEFWNYGGYEKHERYLDAKWLYATEEDWVELARVEQEKRDREEARKLARRARQIAKQAADELEMYNTLHAKYGDGVAS